MGRERTRKGMKGRFLALPHGVIDSQNFIGLSAPAVRLLLDIGRQYAGTKIGRLLCTLSLMKSRGWSSNDTLIRARRELESAGFIQLPDLSTLAGLDAAQDDVTRAVSNGELLPGEGETLTNILDARRRFIESADLERRIAALEDASESRK